MSDSAMTAPNNALAAKQAQEKSYRKKGLFIALMSGFLYGGYTAFMTQGMATGVWVDYYGGTGVAAGLSAFALVYTLSAVGAAVNDICSAVWTLIYAAIIGRLGDFARSINTKPGRILIVAAIIGGPLASTAYVIGLQMAGSIIVPIAALNAAIGAIIGRIIYKQKLSGGMILGIVICFAAAVIIGLFGYGIPEGGLAGIFGNMSGEAVIGIIAAFCAALGWGIEGAVGGYACCMVDTEVAICIRQCTSGIVNAVILCSLLSLMGGDGIGSGLALLHRRCIRILVLQVLVQGCFHVRCCFRYGLQWYIRILGTVILSRCMRTYFRRRRMEHRMARLGRSYHHGNRYLRSRYFAAEGNREGGVGT